MRPRALGWILASLACALPLTALPQRAAACGGFFCASTPVDQNAERVLFKVRADGRTDMIVQITYQGKAEDFAWVLPLAEPPKKEDLGVFPQRALTALDAQSGPVFTQPCAFAADSGASQGAGGFPPSTNSAPVDVYVRTQIGNYDVAVIGSTDASAAAQWLTDNGFRISDAMKGYITLYTQEGMKFLALKLLPDKTANDITPFKLTLPGSTPSIPLRLSAVAAEPEMGIVVWVLGDKRYEPANAPDLTIDDADLRFASGYFGQSNWSTLVARAVDEHQGMGFVTEYAESTANLRSLLMNSFANTPEQQEAASALESLFDGATYITRMYTRVSPEEMTYDPVFRGSAKGDVSRFHTTNATSCGPITPTVSSPCDFTACGALGLCREVGTDDAGVQAGCACAGGSTARTTFVPGPSQTGFTATVSCVDQRLSYLNPGDRNAAGEALPDPCVGVSCGGHGKCVAMNMTATCDCETGYVAVGSADDLGNRFSTCALPKQSIPPAFYNRRPLPRDPSLPLGRDFEMAAPSGASDGADPLPEGNAMAQPASSSKGGGGCAVRGPDDGQDAPLVYGLSLLGLGLALRRRRR